MSYNRDAELDPQGKRALIGYECSRCVREIDSFNDELFLLDQFMKEEPKMGAWCAAKMTAHVLLDNSISINPFLEETRIAIQDFLAKWYEGYYPDDKSSVIQALLKIAADGRIESLKELCNHEIERINALRI